MPQSTSEQAPQENRFSLILEQELQDAMRKLARQHDRSLAAEMRQALREYVERENGHNGRS